jgi:hypothetical protein
MHMVENTELLERVNRPVVLRNRTCGYCGRNLLTNDVAWNKEHVIGRGFVPKGSLENQWNVIFRTCLSCNGRKSDLEDDISAITMQPDGFGHFHQFDHPLLVDEALRKGTESVSRITGRRVGSSQEHFTHRFKGGPMTLEVSYVSPPQIDEHRIAELAHFHVTGFLYWLLYNKQKQVGGFIDARFYFLSSAPQSDWGNKVHRAFMHLLEKLKKICRKARITPSAATLHALRHPFGSHLRMAGVPLANIADLMGHKDLATTQIYAKLEVEHLREAVSRLSSLVPEREEKKVSRKDVTPARLSPGRSRKLLKANDLEAGDLNWLGGRDSNPDSAVQSRMSYH